MFKLLHRDIEEYNFREVFLLEVHLGLDPEIVGSDSILHCCLINEALAGDCETPPLHTLPL